MAHTSLFSGQFTPVNSHTITWLSDGSGNYSESFGPVNGVILRVVTDPGPSAPTDNYDVTCTDANGYDVFAGLGGNRDTANTESFCPMVMAGDGTTTTAVPIAVSGTLALSISNAGSSKSGTVVIYTR